MTSDVLLEGWQGLEGLQESQPVGLEQGRIGDDLPVGLNLALAPVEVDGHVEAIGDVELDDIKEPGRRGNICQDLLSKETRPASAQDCCS